jgi:proline iminopeptidase
MVMHGGPGAGSHTSSTRFFDPQRYRLILFDQRGCGKSTPRASEDDARAALTDNTTQHLIDDVSALRRELNINGKMHVFGGSWGSTLALAAAGRAGDGIRPRKSGSHRTPRWREVDSNHRSPSRDCRRSERFAQRS